MSQSSTRRPFSVTEHQCNGRHRTKSVEEAALVGEKDLKARPPSAH